MRPRVVFLTSHLPYPPLSGGRLREYELLRRLGEELDVHVCAISKTYDHDVRHLERLRETCAEVTLLRAAAVDKRPTASGASYQALRHACREARKLVRRAAANADLVHVEGYYLLQHVPEDVRVPLLLVEQNVECHLWAQRAEAASDTKTRLLYAREHGSTMSEEVAAWRRADLCGVLTEEDRVSLRTIAGARAVLVPDGADHLPLRESSVATIGPPTVVFVANFAYQPNQDAVAFLLEEVWPHVSESVPHARLFLVGSDPPDELRRLEGAHVSVTGRVDAVEPYLDSATVVVAPLRVGGGVKVKVLEALRRGKAIVTTPVGAQGLGPDPQSFMRVEPDGTAMARSIVELLTDADERRRMEQAALQRARELPTWDEAAAALRSAYASLVPALRGPARARPARTSAARP